MLEPEKVCDGYEKSAQLLSILLSVYCGTLSQILFVDKGRYVMPNYKNMKYPALLLFSVCMSLNAFGATTILSPPSALEEKGEELRNKRPRIESPASAGSESILADSAVSPREDIRERLQYKSKLLMGSLPKIQGALSVLQGTYQSIIDNQKGIDQLAAFKAACSLANLQALSSSVQDIIYCLKTEDNDDIISIGVGASPGIKQEIDQLIICLDETHQDSSALKSLAVELQKITGDIPNPEFPADSIL